MLLQMPLLPVDGNEKLWFCQRVDDLQFLAAGVTGSVQPLELVVYDIRTLAVQLVDDARDGLFVAGNRGGRDDHMIPRLDFHLPVAGEGHAVQSGHILAL